ncbi:9650_t:CDS:10 [Cetraspora pellucida]|uniref:9650_t:CDS:1 n=1 Tax=Cetraspora pellucida TaxID=1433469 RepID=A0A9N9BB55_9GLOM|nr:9650_t:CDS:10 [Cetraspora pellucida]
MSSLKEWFNAAVIGEEFNEIKYNDLKELVFIDRGGFGEVYSANCVSINNTVAVKKVFQSYLEKQDVFDAFIKELKLHRKLGDNNRIINFLGISKDPNDGSHLIGSVKTPPQPTNMGHHSTLIFDENLAIPLTSNKETSPDYGNCKRCEQKFTDVEWCKNCECESFRRNFDYWTSGNKQLNELIKKSQLEATHVSNYIEWIENDQLEDMENIVKGRFSTINTAIWRNGPREVWDEETGQWERASKTKVAIKYLKASGSDFQPFLNEVKLHVCCDKVIRCYGITKDYQTGEYGLVQKYASYGCLRSFINERGLIGWLQKLKILEGIILGLNQIHLRAGYCHRDLHSGNILIDQDELNQFDSANKKVQGFNKFPLTMNDQLYYTSKALSTKLISKLKHQSIKYESIEYKFDQNYHIVKGDNTELQSDKDDPIAKNKDHPTVINGDIDDNNGFVVIEHKSDEDEDFIVVEDDFTNSSSSYAIY